MFLAAILGYNKRNGKLTLAIGLPTENHSDVYMRVAGRLDITDAFGFVDPVTFKYYNRKNAAVIAEKATGNHDLDFESSEGYLELRDKC